MTASPSPAAAARSRTDRPSILLVEDDAALRQLLAALLAESGYAVAAAGDHRAALGVIEAAGPLDLLMTDLMLPSGVSGFALGRLARMRRPQLEILYFTGYDIPPGPPQPGLPILRKPLRPASLLAAIDGLLH